MRRRIVLLGLVAALGVGAATTPGATAAQPAPAVASKACKSGWTHGVIGGQHKCLRAGQFCARSADRQYHRYRYHCHKRDSSGRYRLTR